MYVREACNLRNSQSPIDPADIAASRAAQARLRDIFMSGDQTLNDLIENLGGNPAGSFQGDAGVPTLGPHGGAWPALQWGGRGADVVDVGSYEQSASACGRIPQLKRLQTTNPVSYSIPAPPVTVAPPALVVVPKPPPVVPRAPLPPEDTSICNWTPETVCEAARAGCFAAGQVDPAQLFACASAGWQGNQNRFPRLIAAGGWNKGQHVGLVNANPASPGGMSGFLDDPATGPFWGLALLGVGAGLVYALGRRRK